VRALLVGTAVLMALAGSPGVAAAQVNCEAMPPGPARTDCFIGLARINRQKSEIAAGVSRQQIDAAIYRNVTGGSAKKTGRRMLPAWKAERDWTIDWPR